ncbi:MAG: ferritin-like domain-containing protein [Vicinamibacterales bacterium]
MPPTPRTAPDSLVSDALQRALTNLITLGLLVKQTKWNVTGVGSLCVRLLLNELADAARAAADNVAERTVTLGATPDGRPETLVRNQTMTTVPLGPIAVRDATRTLGTALAVTIDQLHVGIDMTTDADPLTRDLLVTTAAALEKHAWMLRAQTD